MQRDSKRICKRYRLRLLRFRLSCDMLFFAYIYCPKESKCHALARFVLFVRLLPFGQWVFDKSRVQKKHSRMNYIKLTTNLPNLSNIYHVEPKKIRVIRAITSLWSVGLRQISCSKKIYSRMNYIKLNTNLPNQTNHLICRQNSKNKSVLNPICPVKVQSKSNENQNINQKSKIKKRIREKDSVVGHP